MMAGRLCARLIRPPISVAESDSALPSGCVGLRPSGDGRSPLWVGGHYILCCFFFFSSRRRHTRSDRDWSSDVCSSDLLLILLLFLAAVVFWAYTKKNEPPRVSFAKVKRETLVSTLITNGKVEPLTYAEIGRASCRERV